MFHNVLSSTLVSLDVTQFYSKLIDRHSRVELPYRLVSSVGRAPYCRAANCAIASGTRSYTLRGAARIFAEVARGNGV